MNDLNNMVKKSIGQSEVIHLGTKPRKKNLINKISAQNQTFNLRNKKYLLHVGSAAWYKNRESVFKAFKSMRENFGHSDLHLVLVGPTPQIHETTEMLRFWVNMNSHYIHNVENISEVDLEVLYTHAEMLLFPSHIEGFGWPPLEAASHGIPVITTKTGAIADILGENAIYINSSDQDALEKTIEKTLISQPTQTTRPSIPTTEECIQKYSDLYKKIMLDKNH
jgi:glycosyltransferase involved in cell wall biosynthesis